MSGIDVSGLRKNKGNKPTEDQGVSITDILNRDIQLFGSGVPDAWKEAFYAELRILLSSGLDIQTTLQLIASEQAKEKHREMVNNIKDDLIGGANLYEALKKNKHFTPYEYFSVKIGEESGRLTTILENLNQYFTNKIQQRRQLISALSYPVIVLFTALLAVVFMLNFIVPMFADVFVRFGGDLPFLTRVVLSASNFMRDYVVVFLLLGIVLMVSIRMVNRKEWFRRSSSFMLHRLPVIGKLVQQIHLAQFCEVMGLLTAARIPMLQAIDMVEKIIPFYPIQHSLVQVQQDILEGKSLNRSLEKFSIYPKRMISLVQVGEEVNQLDQIFKELARQYTEEVGHQTKLLSTLLEPLLMIFLGFVVGFILVAMYLPMFSLSNSLF